MNSANRKILSALTGDPFGGIPGTHMHAIGASGLGKSKFLESLIRDAIEEGHGLCVIDWAGSLYDSVIEYLSYFQPRRDVYLLNPSNPVYVTPYNPFIDAGDDAGTTVSHRIGLTVKPWDAKDTNATPRIAKIARILYSFAVAAGETLPNAATVLEHGHKDVREYALRVLDAPEYLAAHRQLDEIHHNFQAFKDWHAQTESTDHRLTKFLGSHAVTRFIGSKTGNLSIPEILKNDSILLVNLARSGYLDDEAAKLFASLLLSDFFTAARKRPDTHQRYLLFLDEFQEYMNLDLARMLDGVRKGGLQLVMAHQHLGHLAEDPQLKKAIFTNARVKAVFGGLDFEDAVEMAHEVRLDEINEREIVETLYTQQVDGHQMLVLPTLSYSESESQQITESSSRTESSSEADFSGGNDGETWMEYDAGSEGTSTGHSVAKSRGTSLSAPDSLTRGGSTSRGITRGTTTGHTYAFLPIHRKEVSGYVERSRDDRTGKWAAALRNQPDRHCTIRIKQDPAFVHKVPHVQSYATTSAVREDYERSVYEATNALPAKEADRLLAESRARFLQHVREVSRTPRNPKKQKAEPDAPGEDPTPNTKRPGI